MSFLNNTSEIKRRLWADLLKAKKEVEEGKVYSMEQAKIRIQKHLSKFK